MHNVIYFTTVYLPELNIINRLQTNVLIRLYACEVFLVPLKMLDD
jgi:hypothetical protein